MSVFVFMKVLMNVRMLVFMVMRVFMFMRMIVTVVMIRCDIGFLGSFDKDSHVRTCYTAFYSCLRKNFNVR